jgi:hypothetical protein
VVERKTKEDAMEIGFVLGMAVIGWIACQGIWEVVNGAECDGLIPDIGQ